MNGVDLNSLPDISAPRQFSYHCSTGVQFRNVSTENTTTYLEINVIQVCVVVGALLVSLVVSS